MPWVPLGSYNYTNLLNMEFPYFILKEDTALFSHLYIYIYIYIITKYTTQQHYKKERQLSFKGEALVSSAKVSCMRHVKLTAQFFCMPSPALSQHTRLQM
jgi:hypothetical protein